jgi:hypothetical protein
LANEDELRAALAPLVAIADAYDANNLDDEARKFWGVDNENRNHRDPATIELYTGRGGNRLLTLEHCLVARRVVRGPDLVHTIQTYKGIPLDQIKWVRMKKDGVNFNKGQLVHVLRVIPHGGNYDCEAQFVVEGSHYISSDIAEIVDVAIKVLE